MRTFLKTKALKRDRRLARQAGRDGGTVGKIDVASETLEIVIN